MFFFIRAKIKKIRIIVDKQELFLTTRDNRGLKEGATGLPDRGESLLDEVEAGAGAQSKSWRRHRVRIVEQKESFACPARIYCLAGMSSVSVTDVDE